MRNTTNSLPPLTIPALLGLVAGLLLGLLIGWVIWPVEWTGATLRDLNPDAKAEYLAAVADAYTIYGNAEAAEQARQRLAPLRSNLAAEFDAAIAYFQEGQSPDKAIRDSNLRRLAGALGVTPLVLSAGASNAQGGDAGIAPTVAVAEGEQVAPVQTTEGEASAPVAEPSGSHSFAWLGWFLGLLTALLMIGGAIYIFMRSVLPALRKTGLTGAGGATLTEEFAEEEYSANLQRRPTVHAAPGEFVDDADYRFADDEEEDEGRRPAARSSAQVITEDYGRSQAFNLRQQPAQLPPDNEEEFDEEFDDDFAEDLGDDLADDLADDLTDSLAVPGALEEDDFGDEDAFDEFDEVKDSKDLDEKKTPDAPSNSNATLRDISPPAILPGAAKPPKELPSALSDSVREAAQADLSRRSSAALGPSVDQLSGARVRPQTAKAELPRPEVTKPEPAKSDTGQPSTRNRQVRYKVLDQHTFQYQMGIPEYDESHPIVDNPSGKYIGEFGMGASTKNGLLQNDPNQLIALDVWLFDKSDERNLGNQTRVLLSEYAVDHNLDQAFLKERQDNPRPFTAQPGVHFQLESQNLLLDCTIVDVVYAQNGPAKGIFQSIKVDMAVQKK